MDDLRAGSMARACAAIDPSEVENIRADVLANLSLRVPERVRLAWSDSRRRRYIEHAQAVTRSCPVALRWYADGHGDRLGAVRNSAATERLTRPFPSELWWLGREDWVIQPRNGSWIITAANALPSIDSLVAGVR